MFQKIIESALSETSLIVTSGSSRESILIKIPGSMYKFEIKRTPVVYMSIIKLCDTEVDTLESDNVIELIKMTLLRISNFLKGETNILKKNLDSLLGNS
jgi:hypothetical protein